VDSFAVKIDPLDEVVVYYSGHGTNQNGINYLAPAGLNLSTVQTYANTAYSLNTLTQKVKGAISSLVILEASRSWSIKGIRASTKSFVTLSPAVGNQAILSAAQPGKGVATSTGKVSLFTRELIRQISSSPEGINALFPKVAAEVKKTTLAVQQPWMSNLINTNFYFNKTQERGIWKETSPMEIEGGGSLNW
nr:caspase family protein [Candidatus Cloacimonadota bacterium]